MKKRDSLLIVLFIGIVFFTINVSADNDCSIIDPELIEALHKYVFIPIKWATPILLLVLTSIDFANVVVSGDKKSMDKVKTNFLKRAAAALIIFFAPDIINLVIDLVNVERAKDCINSFSGTSIVLKIEGFY